MRRASSRGMYFLFTLGFIAGVHPFGLNFEITKLKVFYFISLNVIVLSLMYAMSKLYNESMFDWHINNVIVAFFQRLSPCAASFIIVFSFLYSNQHISHSLNILEEIDQQFTKCESRSSSLIKIEFVLSLVFTTLLTYLHVYLHILSANLWTFPLILRRQIPLYQYSFFLEQSKNILTQLSKFSCGLLNGIKCYNRLRRAAVLLNRQYSFSILVIALDTLCLTTSHIYFIIRHLFRETKYTSWIIFDVFALSTFVSFLYSVVLRSHNLRNEVGHV